MTYLDTVKGWTSQGAWQAVACCRRAVLGLATAVFLVLVTYSPAAAEIVIDGNLTEPDYHLLGSNVGGPLPGFGAGHEINALYANLDPAYFYLGVAGNVQLGHRILVFIDSIPGGYNTANFGRAGAPPGIAGFNPITVFDANFYADYVLVIGAESGRYVWNMYTLSPAGGPNLFLGDQNDADLKALPGTGSLTSGFESRLTYSATGAGVDFAINQAEVKLFAAYIRDDGYLSNQFITRANPTEPNFGGGQVFFNIAIPTPVVFAHFLVVNEVDHTQPGGDVAEFIEIKNISGFAVNLDPYYLELVNGIGGGASVYRVVELPNIILAPGQYYVVCTNPANVPGCNLVAPEAPAVGWLENTLPSAVALRYRGIAAAWLVDTVSYGGNTGIPFTEGQGVQVAGEESIPGLGISRFPDGIDTNQNSIDFSLRCITPGQPNSPQNSNCVPVTPTPTGTVSPTPTPIQSPTPFPTLPSGCVNVITNGDFEHDGAWIFGGSPIPGQFNSIEKRSGLRAVRLGDVDGGHGGGWGKNQVSYSSIRQLVTIPRGASIAQLRWWHFYRSDEGPDPHPSSKHDRQEVILLTPHGKTLSVLQRVRRNDSGWTQSMLDLTEFRGQSFYVYFNIYNDKSPARTWGFLDDVMVEVCYPEMTSTPVGTPTPTWTVTPSPSMTPLPSATPLPTDTPTLTPTPTMTQITTPTLTPTPTMTPTPTGTAITSPGTIPPGTIPPGTIPPVSIESFSSQSVGAPLALSAPPAECVELVNNGTFEAIGPGWELTDSAVMPAYATEITFNQSYQALRLGITDGANVVGVSAASQNVTLPPDATSIVLSFRYFPLYEEPPGAGDLQYVDVYNVGTGQLAGRVFGDQMNDRTWLTTDYDLTAQAGQTLRLIFAVNNDGAEGRTAMVVDQVSLMACSFRSLTSPETLAPLTPLATESPAVSQLISTPRAPVAVELTAARQSLADESAGEGINTRAWMARLGTVSMLLGVLGIIGFVALVIIGAVRARD